MAASVAGGRTHVGSVSDPHETLTCRMPGRGGGSWGCSGSGGSLDTADPDPRCMRLDHLHGCKSDRGSLGSHDHKQSSDSVAGSLSEWLTQRVTLRGRGPWRCWAVRNASRSQKARLDKGSASATAAFDLANKARTKRRFRSHRFGNVGAARSCRLTVLRHRMSANWSQGRCSFEQRLPP